jgi:hypothetical protein
MATRLVNGIEIVMKPEESAAHDASRTPTLAQARRFMRERIAARREDAEAAGFLVAGTRFGSGAHEFARAALLGERARTAKAASQPFNVQILAADGTTTTNMNANELIAFEVAAADHLKACSDNARVLRQAVSDAADVVAVLAVNIDAGWPA